MISLNKNLFSKSILLVFLVLALCSSGFAQKPEKKNREPRHPSLEKLEALRTKYVIKELALSDKELEKFTPMYAAYRKEHLALIGTSFKDHHSRPGAKEIKEMTDSEAKKFVERGILKQRQLLELKEKYIKKFSTILSSKKVALLFQAEMDFHKKLFKRMGNRRKEKQPKRD